MDSKKTNQPIWLYVLLGVLAIALIFFLSSLFFAEGSVHFTENGQRGS